MSSEFARMVAKIADKQTVMLIDLYAYLEQKGLTTDFLRWLERKHGKAKP